MAKTFAKSLIRNRVSQNITGVDIQLEFTDKHSMGVTGCDGTSGFLIFRNREVRFENVW